MKADVDKILGKPFNTALKFHDQGDALCVALKGDCWNDGPLADEQSWISFLAGEKRRLVIDISGCRTIGVYTLQWLSKLGKILNREGRALELQGATKASKALIQTLNVKPELIGMN